MRREEGRGKGKEEGEEGKMTKAEKGGMEWKRGEGGGGGGGGRVKGGWGRG
jgi:hypothetical protein